MLQQHVFPLASGFPTPTERVREREQVTMSLFTLALYVLFLFTPGAVAGLSVALGRFYGLSVYRFFVSWLFFWVTGLLTLDPFVVRYRSQLSDLIHHWHRVLDSTKTCLNVTFEHGFLYFAMLWSLSYAFVFVEAILALFWELKAAIQVTTFAFGTCMVVYLVVWIGKLVKQHSHLAFSNQTATMLNDGFLVVDVSLEDRKDSPQLQVRLPNNSLTLAAPNLSPDVQLSASNRLDLTGHLSRNRQQMTIAGNVLTVEPLDRSSSYGWYRNLMWLLLFLLGSCILALVLRDSFDLFELDPRVEYGAMATFVAGVLLLVFLFGQKFSDPTYLQFFLLLSTFFPTVYGSWLLTMYADLGLDSTSSQTSSAATLIMVLHLLMSDVYLFLMQLIVRHFSAPFLYVRFMMLPQTMSYVFELVIFGFTPWSAQYLLVLLFSSTHNILSSTGLYWDLFHSCQTRICGPPAPPPLGVPAAVPADAGQRLFEHLLSTRYSMQLFAQDTIADVWSFAVVLTTLAVVWGFGVPITEIMPSFTMEPIVLRLLALVVARVLSWLCGQIIFRHKLDRESSLADDILYAGPPLTLSDRLDEYLRSFKLSVFQTAELRTCYEEDMPELFAAPAPSDNANNYLGERIDPLRLTMRELMVMQIAERQWLLHPALLRKHFMYFHADMYLLLFIVFQAASKNLPLRYAWFKSLS